MDLCSTIKGSLLETFFPEGWDLKRIDECCSQPPEEVCKRMPWWNRDFQPIPCEALADFDMMMGHEIALEIKKAKDAKKQIRKRERPFTPGFSKLPMRSAPSSCFVCCP